MTAFDRFDQRLANGLDDLAAERYPEYFDDVLELAVRRSQRPAWTFIERWLPMSTVTRRTVFAPALPWRTIAILAALLALLIAALAVSIGMQPNLTPAPAFGRADNGAIAYSIDGEIYARDLEGGEPRLLVGGEGFDVSPVFSRDGTQLAFFRVSAVSGGLDEELSMLVANADGSDARVLIGPAPIYSFAWSPASDELAVIMPMDGEQSLVIVGVEEGATPRTIELAVSPTGEVDWRPPDGGEIVFRGQESGLFSIYTVRPDGSDLERLTPERNDQFYWGPYALSPDGSQLAYTQGGDQVVMHVLNLETGADRLWGAAMPAPEAGFTGITHWGTPVYSADGTKFVLGRYWDEHDGTINHQVWVASVAGDGANAVPIGVVHRSQAGSNPFGYGFAPDDTRVLIQDTDVQVTWLADPAGGEPERLEWGPLSEPPNWQRLAP